MLKKLLLPLALALFASVGHAQTPVLDFTLSASSADGKTVIPKLTWTTTPAATSCSASGTAGSGWSGTQPVSGTQTLAAVSVNQAYALQCSWPGATRATVVWTPPTTNTDGSAYTDKGGFKVYYGTSATARTTVATVADPAATSWQSPVLTPATYFFSVTAFNLVGLESAQSGVGSKVITADAQQTRNIGLSITVPNAPILQ